MPTNIEILRNAIKQQGPVLHNCPPNFPLKETLADIFQLLEIYSHKLQQLEQSPNNEMQELKDRMDRLEKKHKDLESQLYRSYGGSLD